MHIVNGYNEIIKLKKEINPTQKWIIHGFNKFKQTQTLLDHRFFLSFGTSLLTNIKLQQALLTCPIDKIVLETDNSVVSIEKMYNFTADLIGMAVETLIIHLKQTIKTITNGKLA